MSGSFIGLYTFIQTGGFTALLLCAAAGLLVLFGGERLFYLFFRISFQSKSVANRIRDLIQGRKYSEALQLCNNSLRAPEIQVVKSGLLAIEHGREAMKSALSSTVNDISRRCESRMSYISLIASSSTLLGLLGTILGLIQTFSALAEADPSEKGRMLGEGISLAMYSTAMGLMVGLAAMVIHTVCNSKIEAIVGKSQDAGFNLVTWVEEAERGKKRV